jgi:hypothetical protein
MTLTSTIMDSLASFVRAPPGAWPEGYSTRTRAARSQKQYCSCVCSQVPSSPKANGLGATLKECEQVLRMGPGGDVRKYSKKQRRSFILRLLYGNYCPVYAGERTCYTSVSVLSQMCNVVLFLLKRGERACTHLISRTPLFSCIAS